MIFKHRFLDNVTFSEHVLVSNLKNKSLKESNILGNENFQPPLQILHAVRHLGGMHKNAFFKGCSTLVTMVTTTACLRPGASFSYKNVAKKSAMFISLFQAKYNITNWHFYHT